MVTTGESVSISTSLPFDNKCICAFRSQSISTFDTKLWFCLINKKLSKTTPFVQVFRKKQKKNALARKHAQNQSFYYLNTISMFLLQCVCFIFILRNIRFWAFFAPNKKWLSDLQESNARYCVSLWWKNTFWTFRTYGWNIFCWFSHPDFCFQNWVFSIFEKRNFQIFMNFWSARVRAHHLKIDSV